MQDLSFKQKSFNFNGKTAFFGWYEKKWQRFSLLKY